MALTIRSQKTVAIIFVAFLLITLLAVNSTYSVQKCQNMQTSIRIIDESGGKRLSGTSVATLEDSPFKNYVTTISKHVSTKIGETLQCSGALNSSPEVELFFVYRPLVGSGIAPFDLERAKSDRTKHLDSPWVKLTLGSSPKLSVRAAFVWSERQFLFDQALLSGARASPTKTLLSIDDRIFDRYVQDYTNSVLLVASPEAEPTAQASISKRLPAEILWLFRQSLQSTFAPFSTEVDYALRSIVQRGESGYTALTNALVDRFLESAKIEIGYNSILDLKDIFAIDKYRINKLH
jgi:hypothetical protein